MVLVGWALTDSQFWTFPLTPFEILPQHWTLWAATPLSSGKCPVWSSSTPPLKTQAVYAYEGSGGILRSLEYFG